jgi:hypothetical protein
VLGSWSARNGNDTSIGVCRLIRGGRRIIAALHLGKSR